MRKTSLALTLSVVAAVSIGTAIAGGKEEPKASVTFAKSWDAAVEEANDPDYEPGRQQRQRDRDRLRGDALERSRIVQSAVQGLLVLITAVRPDRLIKFFPAFVAEIKTPQHEQRVMAHGATTLRSSAAGSRMRSLLRSDPAAIFAIIGSSRLGDRPTT